MKRILSNFRYILKISFKYTGIIFAILGFIGVFAPLNDIFSVEKSLIKKILISCFILIGIWLVLFLTSCIFIYYKKCYEILYLGNGHHMYVQYGDIFSARGLKGDVTRNIVIPVNRCFDTIIDDDLISSRTLHGMSMKKMYSQHIYTQEELNRLIQEILSNNEIKYKMISIQNKRKGNLKRYETGTVVEIPKDEKITYFFLALTSFDKDLHAHIEDEEYVLALMRLLMYNNKRSQGKPLFIPLIGSGAADTKKDEQDILEYFVKFIKMYRKLINCDVHIVVRNDAEDAVSITAL